jgi:MYXO-CTERM domain-containing protein
MDTFTFYLWAQLSSASSTAIGLDFVETSPSVVTVTSVSVANPVVFYDADEPQNAEAWLFRWNGYDVTTSWVGGFSTVGGFNDPQGVNAVGLSSYYGATDPTRRGSAAPYQYYVGSFTVVAASAGLTEIFLTVNDTLILGNNGMLSDLHFGAGDGPVPVSTRIEGALTTSYIASGVHSTLADATIYCGGGPPPVEPEPGTAAMLAVGALALVRRR